MEFGYAKKVLYRLVAFKPFHNMLDLGSLFIGYFLPLPSRSSCVEIPHTISIIIRSRACASPFGYMSLREFFM
ncbi:hypothetical protein EVA_06521 [gut metagenome]|uniref:Uncharacterized protein n=1 Tax=gut metagenome TaxID=749906 RepID=J9GXB9_9ZZZZ